jgi:plastocyanin domain-containing protein
MKTTTAFIGIVIIIALVGFFVFSNSGNVSGNVIGNPVNLGNSGNSDVQQVTLSMKNYNYYPNTIKVRAGQPVSITLDSTVYGCFRAFTIRELGISKLSGSPTETIDFTPNKKGSFTFACSMGMGTGTIIVE